MENSTTSTAVNPGAAVSFLESLPGLVADLTAIHPTTNKIVGKTFNVKRNTDDRAACLKFIGDATAKGYGLYFNINSLRTPLGPQHPKANESEVDKLNAFHVDADVDKDITDPAAFAAAKSELLRAIEGMNRPPTIIVDSGNGYGLFWLLRKPVRVTAANLDTLKGVNIALRDAVPGAADACQNLDRVMRLPFTMNRPNAAKIKRGRVAVPTDLITPEWADLGALYRVEDFEAAPVESPPTAPADDTLDIPDSVDLSRLDDDMRKLVEKGPAKGRKIGDGSRSSLVFLATQAMISCGFTDGEIIAVLTNPDLKVSEHVLDQKQRTPEQTAIKTIRDARAYGAVSAAEAFADSSDDAEEAAALDKLVESWKLRDKAQRQTLYDHRDFLLYLPGADKTKFIFAPTGSDDFWSATAVNLKCDPQPIIDPRKKGKSPDECEKIDGTRDRFLRKVDKEGELVLDKDDKPIIAYQSAADWIMATPGQHVAVVTWWPGKPPVIRDTIVVKEGGVIPKKGLHSFNRYRPPRLTIVTPGDPSRWLDHLKLIYPDDWQHILYWLAWRVQHPEQKVMHALVLGGASRIGKDMLLKPVAFAIGPWNFGSTNAQTIMDEPKFNPYLESVICLIHEAKDFGDQDRYAFYHRIKPWLGGEARGVLMCADKNVKVHAIADVFAAIITTNFKLRGLYIPADDARIYFAWSKRTRADWGMPEDKLEAAYFKPLQRWYENGGYEAVAHYLRTLDLTKADFSPTAPPPKTEAWREVVAAGRDHTENVVERILELLGNPAAVTVDEVRAQDSEGELDWMSAKGRNQVAPQMEAAHYIRVPNPNIASGRWVVGPKNSRREIYIYGHDKLTVSERRKAALEVFDRETVKAKKPPKDEEAIG